MLIDDLKKLQEHGTEGYDGIVNKYKAEMIYYMVIEQVMKKYGTSATNEMSKINHDALGCARDQMAMRASDSGVIRYDENGHIQNLSQNMLQQLIHDSFLNSEALRKTISAKLASDDYRSVKMSDDELYERTKERLEWEADINKEGSLARNVWMAAQHFDDSMENSGMSLYAMKMADEAYDSEQGIKTIPDPLKQHIMLKISPLIPELRNLRRIGVDYLGLSDTKNAKNKNSILQYDAQKGVICVATTYDEYVNLTKDNDFRLAFAVKPTEYSNQSITIVERNIGPSGYDDAEITSNDIKNATERKISRALLSPSKLEEDIITAMKWRMIETIEQHSTQMLTDADIYAINDIFENSKYDGGWLFGNMSRIGLEGIETNANAYFDYIDHICTVAKEKIPSHEFEIHFSRASYNEHATSDRLYSLYFTGEQTSDYSVAKKSGARFLNTFVYANYTPKNSVVSPMVGDMASASFNSYIITNKALRAESSLDGQIIDNTKNHFFHSRRMTPELVEQMRRTFDEYTMQHGEAVNDNIVIRKISRHLGDTNIDDISEFINIDGVVSANRIFEYLREDRNNIKKEQRRQFLGNINNVRCFDTVLQTYMDKSSGAENMGEALYNTMLKNSDIRTIGDLRKEFASKLLNNLGHELRDQYGVNQSSFIISNHIFTKFIQSYVNDCMDKVVNHLKNNGVSVIEPVNKFDIYSAALTVKTVDLSDAEKTIRSEINGSRSDILNNSLDELFGAGNVIKPNTCKHASRKFAYDMYEDMLKLMSYNESVVYENDKLRTISDMDNAVRRDNSIGYLQLYSNAILNSDMDDEDDNLLSIDAEEEIENTDDETSATDDVSFDGEGWYISTFAKVNNEDDLSMADINRKSGDAAKDMAVFRATHPLQVAALKRVEEHLKNAGTVYDPENLKVTKQGIIYYQAEINDNMSTLLKIGPVIDERAYIQPLVIEDDENGEWIERPIRDKEGRVLYDAQGKTETERVRVRIENEIQLDIFGDLKNPVLFGALDTPSFIGKSNSIPNRFYGISAKVDSYDGYDHRDEGFIDRLRFSTYQTSILNAIDDNMALYQIARHGTNDAVSNRLPLSILYTNVGASSLLKCYQTNTYILEDKHKCEKADYYLSHMLEGETKFDALDLEDRDNPDAREALKKVANIMMMQSKMYHNRVVMPKIKLDQNIGLYNMVLNLSQCSYNEALGTIDRKNMRMTDEKSSRVAIFNPNPMFDDALSGTAKQLGAVAFFTDAVAFNPITGECKLDPNAGNEARCTLISTGILDVENGEIVCRMNNYPGGQATDRQQLSNNASEKALNYATNIKFAMINLGDNMEDGYCVGSRSAAKIGHFGKDGKFHVDSDWDKIGDTESGNKGVTAKVIDTSIAEDIEDDVLADIEFRTVFTQRYFTAYMFNYSKNSDENLSTNVVNELDDIVSGLNYIEGNTFAEKLAYLTDKYVSEAKELYSNSSKDDLDKALEDAYSKRDVELKDFYAYIGEKLEEREVQPFYGAYKLNQTQWRLYRDNPDLDLAVTNVCVLTRSNPSLLMYITDALHKDQENGTRESVLITRDKDGNKIENNGACGFYNIYVDSHTAEDKNRDYTESFSKSGRKYGSQELYALTAKFCNDSFIRLVTANDPTFSDRIMTKLNHKLMMNGFMFDPNTPDLKARRVEDVLGGEDGNGIHLVQKSEDDPANLVSEDMPCTSFVDVDYFADTLVSRLLENGGNVKDIQKAVEDLAELKFGNLFALEDPKATNTVAVSNMIAEDRLHYFFATQFGQFGGNFAILPESLESAPAIVYHNVLEKPSNNSEIDALTAMRTEESYDDDFAMFNMVSRTDKFKPDGKPNKVSGVVNIETADGLVEKRVVPVFMASKEFMFSDGVNANNSVVSDKLQFNIYKTILAGAVLDRMHKYIDDNVYSSVRESLKGRLERSYQNVTKQDSLNISDMGRWLKKNVYNFTFPNSLTTVWAGSAEMEIDEAGLSFEKAKSLGLLRVKDKSAPDDYEHMAERYHSLTDDDLVLINRSPGQTTGCIRALRPRIISAEGDGLKVHPAIATIFDGDFDGDTIGVINYRSVTSPGVTKEMISAATDELKRTMTIQANMVHTADYTSVVAADGHTIEWINPLFIAGNADIAIAKYNMKQAGYTSSSGKSVSDTLDSIMVSANITEQLKQINNDLSNVINGHITPESFVHAKGGLLDKRTDQIAELETYFSQGDVDGEYIKGRKSEIVELLREKINLALGDHDKTSPDYITRMQELSKDINSKISETEKHNKEQLTTVYRDMSQYMTNTSLYTHGDSDYEILENIIKDANISKKGKEPQLNALLMFSGIHARCNEVHNGVKNTGLIVVKDENTGEFEIRMQYPEHPEGVKIEKDSELRAELIKTIRLDYKRAVSDVPKNDYKTQIESNITAQSDKSDATGLGGATAQKMQKIFGATGYAELGLRISGPLTQIFLDAKQNVTVCEKNLMAGKFLLNKICNFEYIHELSNVEFSKSKKEQVRNGQFTFEDPADKKAADKKRGKKDTKRYLTVQEGIEQLDNFMDMMNLPRFSPIDKEIMTVCLNQYADKDGYLKNVIKQCDSKGDRTYAAMYGNNGKFVEYLYESISAEKGLYSGSVSYSGKVNVKKMVETVESKNARHNVSKQMSDVVSQELQSKEGDIKVVNIEAEKTTKARDVVVAMPTSILGRSRLKTTIASQVPTISESDNEVEIEALKNTMSDIRERTENVAKQQTVENSRGSRSSMERGSRSTMSRGGRSIARPATMQLYATIAQDDEDSKNTSEKDDVKQGGNSNVDIPGE